MIRDIEMVGGRIDKVYYSTGGDLSDPKRKPNLGLLDCIKVDYSSFNPAHACLVGNRDTDMQFAKDACITGIHYTDNGQEETLPFNLAQWRIHNWGEFGNTMHKIISKKCGSQ